MPSQLRDWTAGVAELDSPRCGSRSAFWFCLLLCSSGGKRWLRPRMARRL